MADLKISEMTPAAELTGAELIECVQGGVNVKQELTGLKTWVNDGVQPFSSTLDALSSFNTNGIMVQTDTSEFIGRTITGTASQVTVTNGDGVSGNPTIGLPASGVTAASYGSSSTIPVLTVNAQGILTAASTAAVGTTFSDSAFRVQDNGDATKQLAFEVSGIATGTTRTWTAPNVAINFGDLSSVATTDFNTLSGNRTRIVGGSYNTVSGTDNVVVMGTNNTLNTSEVVVEGADWYNTTLFPLPRQTVKSSKASATTSKRVIRSTVCLTSGPDGIGKYATVDGTQTLTASYLPKAVAYDAAKIRRATHKITAMVHSDGNVEGGFFERIVRVTQLNAGSTAIADSKIVATDTDDFGLSFNYGLTITLSASAGDALLKIVGTCTSISGGTPNNCSVSCVVESIYHIDS